MDELLQFRASPYNEKVRWALDLKRAPHVRRSLLPGPHAAQVRKLTGQTSTPVFKSAGTWIAGSAAIVAEIERRYPEPALYPADADARAAALKIEERFDADWGPRMRRAVFGQLLRTPRYIARVFAAGASAPARAAYGLMSPFAAPLIRKGNGISGVEDVEDGERAIVEALDWTRDALAGRAYLVGDAFSIADMAAAAFIAMVIDIPGTPMAKPRPPHATLAAWFERWRGHPADVWTRGIYARHRGAVKDFEGEARYAALATKTVAAE